MENKICAVTKDLLPLYQDDVLREESKEFVKEHLEACQNCRQYKSDMEQSKLKYIANNIEELDKLEVDSKNTEELRIKNIAFRLRSRRRKIIAGIIALFLFVVLLLTQVFQFSVISGGSMEPTYPTGENVIVNKLSYLFVSPKRGDVIFIQHNGSITVKRIVGLPGETLDIRDGELCINGDPIELRHMKKNIINPGNITYPVKLGDGEYFVLGDNLDYSLDSRFKEYGVVIKNEIYGKVISKSISFFQIVSHDQYVAKSKINQ